MNMNLQPLSFDEFGAPESSWKEARSPAKKRYLILIYTILVVDVIALFINLLNYPYTAFDIFQIVAESLIVVILLPKVLGIWKGIRILEVEDGCLKIKSGIVYRKNVPLNALEKVSISPKRNSHRRLVLHYPNGKKEETRFLISLSLREDRKRMLQWVNEVNILIEEQRALPD